MGRATSVPLPTHTSNRVRIASSYSKHEFGLKKHKSLEEDDDKISKLPDDVLVSILSLLTITEAARTSILSHRWKKLWIFSNGSLSFDLTKRLCNVKRELWPNERSKFITWMSQVLRRLMLFGSSSTLLEAFTVRFDKWDNYPKCFTDKCVKFAMGKRIQRLELDMKPIELCSVSNAHYSFPIEFYAWIKQPCGLYRISALTSLTMNHINVSGEFIEYLLSNCPLLERLCVVDSRQISKLKVTGAAALKLKYLDISYCYKVESVEISAPNLCSFKYDGSRTKLHVENVPQLVELFIGSPDVISYISGSLSSYLSQLETFTLHMDLKVNKRFTPFFVLNKLKHLTFRVIVSPEESILGWTSLIEACPLLQKFTLETIAGGSPEIRRKVRKVTCIHCHQCLKVVELVGFTGVATEVELAMYFFASATALEQIIIDLHHPILRGTPFELDKNKRNARIKRGLQLKRYLPPGVKLVLI